MNLRQWQFFLTQKEADIKDTTIALWINREKIRRGVQ